MDASAHCKQRSGIQHANIAAGVGILQPLTRRVIALVSEARADDRTIAHIVIDVAVVHPITIVFQRVGRLERQYFKAFITELLSEVVPQGEIRMILAGLLVDQQAAIWLSKGLWRDNFLNGTKGHVDIVACFAPDGRLLVHQQTSEDHPDFALWDDLAQQFSDEGLEILPLEAPLTLKDSRDWVDYSYINHYVCNGAVICPRFDDPRDDAARERLEDAYPGRDIRMLDARALFAMGGGIHCITQQQPSGIG